MKNTAIVLLFIALFIVLSINILQMPSSFTTDALSYNDTIVYYYENAVQETGAVNVIAAIITDYRAFDTLGETIVLFTSTIAVASILKVSDHSSVKQKNIDKEEK